MMQKKVIAVADLELDLGHIEVPEPTLGQYALSVLPLGETLRKEVSVFLVHLFVLLINSQLDRGRSRVDDASLTAENVLKDIAAEKLVLASLLKQPTVGYPSIDLSQISLANQRYLNLLQASLSNQTQQLSNLNRQPFSAYGAQLTLAQNSTLHLLQQLGSLHPDYVWQGLLESPGVSARVGLVPDGIPVVPVASASVSPQYADHLAETVRLATEANVMTGASGLSAASAITQQLSVLTTLENSIKGFQGSLNLLSMAASTSLPVPILLGMQALLSVSAATILTLVGRYNGTERSVVTRQVEVARSVSAIAAPLMLWFFQGFFGLSASANGVAAQPANHQSRITSDALRDTNGRQTSIIASLEAYQASLPVVASDAAANTIQVLGAAAASQLSRYAGVRTLNLTVASPPSRIYFINPRSATLMSTPVTAVPGTSTPSYTSSIGSASPTCYSALYNDYQPISQFPNSKCDPFDACLYSGPLYVPACLSPDPILNPYFSPACVSSYEGPRPIQVLDCVTVFRNSENTVPTISPSSVTLNPDRSGVQSGRFVSATSQAVVSNLPFGVRHAFQFNLPSLPDSTQFTADFGNGLVLSMTDTAYSLVNNGVTILTGNAGGLFNIERVSDTSSVVRIGDSSVTVPMSSSTLSAAFTAALNLDPLPASASVSITGLTALTPVTTLCDSSQACRSALQGLNPQLSGVRYTPVGISPGTANGGVPDVFDPLSIPVPKPSQSQYEPVTLGDVSSVSVQGFQLSSMVTDISLQTLLFAVFWYFSVIPTGVNVASAVLSFVDPHEEMLPNPGRVIARTLLTDLPAALRQGLNNLLILLHFIRTQVVTLPEEVPMQDLGSTRNPADREFQDHEEEVWV